MYTFKRFLTEQAWPDYKAGSSIKDYADKVTPRVAGGFGGGATTGRLAAALRFGNKVIAGPTGEPHSGLASYADKLGKPDAMGFVRKEPGDTSTGEHGGAFFSRQQATAIGNKHPDIKNDPTPENPKYPSQSYDFKPESGKGGKKKVKEEVYSFKEFLVISEEKDAAKKKKPAAKKKNVSKFGIANKEATHGGMSYYGQGEL